jgi:hypothetical protein
MFAPVWHLFGGILVFTTTLPPKSFVTLFRDFLCSYLIAFASLRSASSVGIYPAAFAECLTSLGAYPCSWPHFGQVAVILPLPTTFPPPLANGIWSPHFSHAI